MADLFKFSSGVIIRAETVTTDLYALSFAARIVHVLLKCNFDPEFKLTRRFL